MNWLQTRLLRIGQFGPALANLLMIGALVLVLGWLVRTITRPVAAMAHAAARSVRPARAEPVLATF